MDMQQNHIIQGFSQIKLELIEKCNLSKTIDELKLWFSFEDDILFVHDYDEHKKNIVLAIHNSTNSSWTIYFKKENYGKRIVQEATLSSKSYEIADDLNELFKSYGFFPVD